MNGIKCLKNSQQNNVKNDKKCCSKLSQACVYWGDWTEFGPCSTSCGDDGKQTRTRECIGGNPGDPGCVGSDSQTQSCFIRDCPSKN